MTEAFPLTDLQRERLSGRDAPFHRACVEHFGFLVTEHGYRMEFDSVTQGGSLVSFIDEHDIDTEIFAVRLLFWSDESSLCCEIKRFAGLDHQLRLRLEEACPRLGIPCPEEFGRYELPAPLWSSVAERVAQLGAFVRVHLASLRGIPL
jgi:hypothetical protein